MAKIILNVDSNISGATTQLKTLEKSVKSIATSLSGVEVNKDLTAQIRALTANYNALAKVAQKYIKVNYENEIGEQRRRKATADATKAENQAAISGEKLNKIREESTEKTKKNTDAVKDNAKATNDHKQSLASMIPQIIKWNIAMTAVMAPLRMLTSAIDDINETLVETEKKVVALQRVAGDSANASALYDLAQKYGQTFENVSDVVERFAKSGYDWSESLKAAEAALIAMNVAELDAEQSSEGLIAVMKQYGYEIESLDYIIGVLNKTSDTAAVTTEELLIALQKTGSTAKNANITFEETVGLITALSEGTAASGQNIGNALRSLIVFTSDNNALDTFAGLSDKMAETVEKFRMGDPNTGILQVWQGLGKELEGLGSQRGTLEDLFGGAELTADIEAQLTQITDSFAEIYGTAGNYRQNYFIALLNNIKEVTEVTENLDNVTSYSQKENEKYLNTYEAKVNTLKEKWHELANDEQGWLGFKKGMVEIATDALNLIENLGGLGGIIGTAVAVATPFLVKWGYNFGAKAIKSSTSGVENFWKKFKAGALDANTALGAIGAVLGIVVTIGNAIDSSKDQAQEEIEKNRNEMATRATQDFENLKVSIEKISESYQKESEEIKKYKKILSDSSAIESEKEIAQTKLLEIQNSLIESNNNYADSLDLVNGKLEDSLEITRDMAIQKIIDEIGTYVSENKFEISMAVSAMEKKSKNIELDGTQGTFWEYLSDSMVTNEVRLYLLQNGIDFRTQMSEDSNILNLIGSVFAPTNAFKEFLSFSEELTDEQKIKKLKDLATAVENSDLSEESILGVKSVLSKAVSELETDSYKKNKNIYYGNQTSQNYIDRFKYDELIAIADGRMPRDEIEKLLIDYEIIDAIASSSNFSEISSENIEEIIDKMDEIKRAQEEANELAEKQLSVEEARLALEKAKTQRDVKVYNAATGQFEYQQNPDTVSDAEQNLKSTINSYNDYIYERAKSEIKALSNPSNQDVVNVIDKWSAMIRSGGDMNSDYIKNSLIEAAGFDPYKNLSTYDKGGVLSGLGGIKATSSDEVVLDPELTRKILSPTSNEEFSQFVKDVGLLFGASHEVRRTAEIVPNFHSQSNFNNRNGGNDYYVNGVQIGRDVAATHTMQEIFDNMILV